MLILACNMPTSSTVGGAGSETVPPPTSPPAATGTWTVTPTLTLTPTLTFTPTFTDTPTITLTPTSDKVMVYATSDTSCRTGPDPVYPVLGYLLVSTGRVQVWGRLGTGGWWFIVNPSNSAQSCWVSAASTLVEGDTSRLPVITPPPLPPTLTPTVPPVPAVNVNVSLNITNWNGACPITIVITAAFTANRSMSMTYQYESSAPGTDGPYTYVFDAAGTYIDSLTVTLSNDFSGWLGVRITAPVTSLTTVPVNYNCIP